MQKKVFKNKKYPLIPDGKYAAILVSQLINKVMMNGEKRKAMKIVYQAAEIVEKQSKEKNIKQEGENSASKLEIDENREKNLREAKKLGFASNQITKVNSEKMGKESLKTTFFSFPTILEKALANIKPGLEMKRERRGHRIPQKIDDSRSLKIALRWLVEAARKKKNSKSMSENLAEEINNAQNKIGEVFKKKENLYKEAERGRVFAVPFHFKKKAKRN